MNAILVGYGQIPANNHSWKTGTCDTRDCSFKTQNVTIMSFPVFFQIEIKINPIEMTSSDKSFHSKAGS